MYLLSSTAILGIYVVRFHGGTSNLPIYPSPWWGVRSSEIAGSCFWVVVHGAQWKGWGSRIRGRWSRETVIGKMVAKPLRDGGGPLNNRYTWYNGHLLGIRAPWKVSNWLWLAQSHEKSPPSQPSGSSWWKEQVFQSSYHGNQRLPHLVGILII